MDYNGRQLAIYRLRTLNSRSVLAHVDIVTDQEMIAKAQLNIHSVHVRGVAWCHVRLAGEPAQCFCEQPVEQMVLQLSHGWNN